MHLLSLECCASAIRVFSSLSVISMTSLATKAPSMSSQFLVNRRPWAADNFQESGSGRPRSRSNSPIVLTDREAGPTELLCQFLAAVFSIYSRGEEFCLPPDGPPAIRSTEPPWAWPSIPLILRYFREPFCLKGTQTAQRQVFIVVCCQKRKKNR